MAKIDTSELSALIDEFTVLSARDSISPASLGGLLRRLLLLIASIEDSAALAARISALEQSVSTASEDIESLKGQVITSAEFKGFDGFSNGAIILHKADESAVNMVMPRATETTGGLMPATMFNKVNGLDQNYAAKTALQAAVNAIDDLQRTGADTPVFSGICEEVPEARILMQSVEIESPDGINVVYDSSGDRFLLRINESGAGGHPQYHYYANWLNAGELGLNLREGEWRPKHGVLYRASVAPYGFYRFDEQGAHQVPCCSDN